MFSVFVSFKTTQYSTLPSTSPFLWMAPLIYLMSQDSLNPFWKEPKNSYDRPQWSCGKVIFSQACVKNSVRGWGRGSVPACTTCHMTRGSLSWEGLCPGGSLSKEDLCLGGDPRTETPRTVTSRLECILVLTLYLNKANYATFGLWSIVKLI